MDVSSSTEQDGEISTPNVLKLSADLRPLMFWMSNATELLNFFQVKVEALEKEWEFEGETTGPQTVKESLECENKSGHKRLINLQFLFFFSPTKLRGTRFSQPTWTPARKRWPSWTT